MNKGLLFVVSAPSGCGKGTILSEILNERIYFSVSSTTRKPRNGEVDGVDYNFITVSQFKELIEENGMLEYAEYCGNYYGTPKNMVEKMRCAGKNDILEIDVQGAMQVKENCKDAILVFIMPPSIAELERRLRKRGTETDEVISRRIAKAVDEISFAHKYNYVVVNDELEKAVEDLKSVISAEEHKAGYAEEFINEVLKNA